MGNMKVAIVTGGASGVGLAVTQHLSSRGWRTLILDCNETAGTQAASRLRNTTFKEVDVTSWASLSSAFDAALEGFGGVDFVFANAGTIERGDRFYFRDPVGYCDDAMRRMTEATSWKAQLENMKNGLLAD